MILDYIIIGLYSFALFVILIYSLLQLQLVLNYQKAKKREPEAIQATCEWPKVTVQLPLYNEKYVVRRLLNNISHLDYPASKLEIQVLDDSTDSSKAYTEHLTQELISKGINAKYIHRIDRKNFKAGALKEGLSTAEGEFIAVFDADFLPQADWLKKTIPHFNTPDIGVVQTRWGHVNKNYSILTKIQAFALDFHFQIEQVGRSFGGHFINFNGTAGIWRKTCIEDAGNWQGDTLTEDLDLSYRAQLKGWKFTYLKDVVTPAELPVVLSAARSQQFRWNKGAAENFRKNFSSVFQSEAMSFKSKLHSFFHLLNSSMFFLILLVAVLSIPVLYIKFQQESWSIIFYILAAMGISTVIFIYGYWTSYKEIYGSGLISFLKFTGLFITFFSIAMGLSVHNTLAILEGHFNKKSAFIRTPKFDISSTTDTWEGKTYINKKISILNGIEILLFGYFIYGIYSAYLTQDFGLVIFHLMLVFGFGFISFKTLFSKA
ncbi:cellulose synthase family protein [Psychroflexus sediminis]|uniref:Glycosyltransferase, catalytic subunit of cellulose synthase and poly-beta-1,6-N-acetylglucosamine synthase n=1 Tax=Psychroflexus sediminis TaxID=470826 RepID=A0A1G7Y1Y1_9FLAO|nr:cellulose synthase family protein [Psychroflexus sediminis]SDG90276.1 Glycosyltransferase, catalytic subunit of cellulose synthase and poly-beta-1,6-N-acetylglucosamine synthase [Psychroflexus sediminis]